MRKIRIPIAVAIVVVLIGGGALLLQGISAEPGCAGKGPCMLYFYTDW
jgi:hypothetical protein